MFEICFRTGEELQWFTLPATDEENAIDELHEYEDFIVDEIIEVNEIKE